MNPSDSCITPLKQKTNTKQAECLFDLVLTTNVFFSRVLRSEFVRLYYAGLKVKQYHATAKLHACFTRATRVIYA